MRGSDVIDGRCIRRLKRLARGASLASNMCGADSRLAASPRHLVQQGVVSTTSAVTAGIVIETVGFRRLMGGLLGPLLGRNAVVDSSWGQAARLPNENVWLGVTNEGVVVCDVGFWSGLPGNVLMRYSPRSVG